MRSRWRSGAQAAQSSPNARCTSTTITSPGAARMSWDLRDKHGQQPVGAGDACVPSPRPPPPPPLRVMGPLGLAPTDIVDIHVPACGVLVCRVELHAEL